MDPYREIILNWFGLDEKAPKKQRHTAKRIYDRLVEDILFTGDSAVGTILNCLLLNHNKIKFIAPCPASRLFDQVIDSVTQEEPDTCIFPDKDSTVKFKVIERGKYIYPQNSKQRKELENVPPFWARCLLIWSKSKAKLRAKNERSIWLLSKSV